MTATPAQVANDLDAQARFFAKREADLAQALWDCARLLRAYQHGDKVDGRTYAGVHHRMSTMETRYRGRSDTQIAKSLTRGRLTLEQASALALGGAK